MLIAGKGLRSGVTPTTCVCHKLPLFSGFFNVLLKTGPPNPLGYHLEGYHVLRKRLFFGKVVGINPPDFVSRCRGGTQAVINHEFGQHPTINQDDLWVDGLNVPFGFL